MKLYEKRLIEKSISSKFSLFLVALVCKFSYSNPELVARPICKLPIDRMHILKFFSPKIVHSQTWVTSKRITSVYWRSYGSYSLFPLWLTNQMSQSTNHKRYCVYLSARQNAEIGSKDDLRLETEALHWELINLWKVSRRLENDDSTRLSAESNQCFCVLTCAPESRQTFVQCRVSSVNTLGGSPPMMTKRAQPVGLLRKLLFEKP